MKRRTVTRCGDCGHEEPRWVGRCPACGGWGTMSDETAAVPVDASIRTSAAVVPAVAARPISEVPLRDAERLSTGLGEFDRVLGGGLVPGAAVLLGGEPGVGKSTLLLQVAHEVASTGGSGRPVLYVSGEESPGQVRLRAERLAATAPGLLVAAESSLPTVLGLVERHAPAVLVLDSIQTISDPALSSSPGSVVQVRECAASLVRLAKSTGTAVVLVGHVTKEGAIAGPRVLEHLVDVVLNFEGDELHALRLLRAAKNRFGASGEIGCFEMASDGLREVADPSRLFVGDHSERATGVALTVALEGPRPLVVEVQALVADALAPLPRRQATGVDASRLPMLVAVLGQRADVDVGRRDLFASAVGGVRLREPAADLAICLAIGSACSTRPVSRRLVAVGEVELAGEIRSVPQVDRRLAEAARLGSTHALVPISYDGPDHGLRLHHVGDLRAALSAALTAPVPAV